MVHAKQFKGRLGFKSRSETLLNQGLVQAVDMLDDYGHPPTGINTRASGRIELECDQYRVTLRLRRLPLRMGVQIPHGIAAPAIFLDVSLEQLFPEPRDHEITELLLAVLLRRLTEALCPLLVFWQDAPKAMSRNDFLGVFAQHDKPVDDISDSVMLPSPQQLDDPDSLPVLSATLTPVRTAGTVNHSSPPARTHAGFSPVDDMADDLERQCDRRAARNPGPADQVILAEDMPQQDRITQRQHIMSWAATGLIAMLSAPIAILLLLVELMRGSQMRPGTQILSVALFIGLLQGAGMVQAAAKVLMLPAP